MPQLHCHVPAEVAAQFQQKAKNAHLSVSKYLTKLIKNEIASPWPEGYFDLFGSWEGETLERPEQGAYEKREVN